MTQSDYILEGNYFQTPNEFVDKVMAYLTSDEYKVLIYALRCTIGFRKQQDHISISQFVRGKRKTNGSWFNRGTGLCASTVRKCLASLTKFGIMRKDAKNDRETNKGDLWSPVWETDQFDMEGLKARHEKKKSANVNRVTKARAARKAPKGA